MPLPTPQLIIFLLFLYVYLFITESRPLWSSAWIYHFLDMWPWSTCYIFFGPSFPNVAHNNLYLIEFLWGLNKSVFLKSLQEWLLHNKYSWDRLEKGKRKEEKTKMYHLFSLILGGRGSGQVLLWPLCLEITPGRLSCEMPRV